MKPKGLNQEKIKLSMDLKDFKYNMENIEKLIQNKKVDDMAKIIVETAMDRGSEDNISCIVVELNKKF